nr:MAG TPA: NUCLEAR DISTRIBUTION PROTEIN NUDE-LIKE 1 PROTEIN, DEVELOPMENTAL PROTEIN, STRUCTURAL.1A [Caudoviricetes sp.]
MTNQEMIENLTRENAILKREAEEWRIKFQHSEDTVAQQEKQIKAAIQLNNRLFRTNQHLEQKVKNLEAHVFAIYNTYCSD